MPPTYYRGCWHVVSRGLFLKNFTIHRTFFIHAALLRQAFAHCGIFLTAATRRCLGRISVPMWPITLSGRLRIVALVSRYPTNQLMRRESISNRIAPFTPPSCDGVVLYRINCNFSQVSRCLRQVTHALLTRSPLRHCCLRSTCMC